MRKPARQLVAITAAIATTFTLVIPGCGNDDPSVGVQPQTENPKGSGAQATQIVGAGGGTIGVGATTLTIPAGAVPAGTTITVTESTTPAPADHHAVTPLFTFAPEGLVFNAPVTVKMKYAGSRTGLAIFWSKLGDPTKHEQVATTFAADEATAQVIHFSTGFVGVAEEDAGAAACQPTTCGASASPGGACSPCSTACDYDKALCMCTGGTWTCSTKSVDAGPGPCVASTCAALPAPGEPCNACGATLACSFSDSATECSCADGVWACQGTAPKDDGGGSGVTDASGPVGNDGGFSGGSDASAPPPDASLPVDDGGSPPADGGATSADGGPPPPVDGGGGSGSSDAGPPPPLDAGGCQPSVCPASPAAASSLSCDACGAGLSCGYPTAQCDCLGASWICNAFADGGPPPPVDGGGGDGSADASGPPVDGGGGDGSADASGPPIDAGAGSADASGPPPVDGGSADASGPVDAGGQQVASATFQPSPGGYNVVVDVTLHTTEPSGIIYYTLDGSMPTPASIAYVAPIRLMTTTTLKAIVESPAGISGVATGLYFVQ